MEGQWDAEVAVPRQESKACPGPKGHPLKAGAPEFSLSLSDLVLSLPSLRTQSQSPTQIRWWAKPTLQAWPGPCSPASLPPLPLPNPAWCQATVGSYTCCMVPRSPASTLVFLPPRAPYLPEPLAPTPGSQPFHLIDSFSGFKIYLRDHLLQEASLDSLGKNECFWDFPGDPVVETLHSQYKGPGFNP